MSDEKGFTLIELLIVLVIGVAVIGAILVFIFIGLGKVVPYIQSQQVTDIGVITWAEEEGYEKVRLQETFRANPQEDLGCVPADHAGFRLKVFIPEENVSPGQEVTLDVCCIGGTSGSRPRCNVVSD